MDTDHNIVSHNVEQICLELKNLNDLQIPIFGIEPHNTEICNFNPRIYIDITDVMNKKIEAMKAMNSQKNMLEWYKQKAIIRAAQAASYGNSHCEYAEAFMCFYPISAHGKLVW